MALSYKNDPEEDERLNPATQAKDLYRQERAPYNRELSDIEKNLDDTADPSQGNENAEKLKNINDAQRREDQSPNETPQPSSEIPYDQTGPAGNRKIDFKGIFRKVGPFGFLGAILFGGGGLGLFFFSPGLLLVQMKEIFTNYGSSASRAAPARYNKMLKYTINNPKVDAACKKSATSKKCTLGTMSKAQKKSYEKAGFKINGDGKNYKGRTRVTSVEFPDGTNVDSGDKFISHTRKSVAAASAANRAYNPSTKVFNGGRFSSNVLKKFGLNKTKEDVSGKNDKERGKDFNKRTGNDISDDERGKRFTDKYKERIKVGAKIKKVSSIAGAIAGGCAAYNVARLTIAAVKVENSLRFVSFAFLFLKAADQIKNNGEIKPETASFLGGVLTTTAATGPKAGLSATDSQGYKIAAYGNEGLLKEFTRYFLLGGNPALISLDKTIQWLNEQAGGRRNIRAACRGIGNPALSAAIIAAVCAGEVFASTATGAIIIPGLGSIPGVIFGAVTCVLTQVIALIIAFLAADQVVSWMVDHVLPWALEMLSNVKLDVDNISPVDAGNAMAVGAGVMLGTTALSRGLKAGSKSDVTTFNAATADDKAQLDRIALYDSRNEPFNIYNEYSFLGSTVRKMGVALHMPSTSGEALSNLGAIISSPLRLLSPNAGASPASMPVSISDADLSACPDNDMKDIGIDCDKMGNPQFVLSPEELAMEVSDNLDHMIPRYINEDGTEVANTTYTKWVANCTEQREAPMGATFMPLEDEDYYWGIGENCLKASDGVTEEDLSNFRVYYNSLGEKEDGDYDPATTAVSTTGGGDINVATFNIFHDDAEQTDAEVLARLTLSVKVLKDNDIDIAGLQEVRALQLANLQKSEYGADIYETYPKTFDNSPNPIIWNKTKYKLLRAATIPITYSNRPARIFILKMQDLETGQQFYFVNTHDPANVQGDAQDRYDNANTYVTRFNELKAEGLPIIFTGDFNSPYSSGGAGDHTNEPLNNLRKNLTYCIMTRNGQMWDTSDAYLYTVKGDKNKTGECPSEKAADGQDRPDHIYLSTPLPVTNYFISPFGKTKNGSDVHDTVMSTISFGAEGDSKVSTNITKVLVIPEENHSLNQMKSSMPYAFSQAQKYGYATNYTAITHPSLPNYIAIAAGSTLEVDNDALPSAHKLTGQSVFGQAISSGKTAKVYAESMRGTCATSNSGRYVARHNPWTYFVDEKSICEQFNVPLANFNGDVAAGKLPNVGMLIPNNCNNAHDCSLATADGWFKARMSTIFNGPDWKSGNLLVVLTADEDDGRSGNKVLTVLMNPAIKSKVVDTNLNHYSLSRLYSEVVGQAGLRNAKDAPSLLSSFGL